MSSIRKLDDKLRRIDEEQHRLKAQAGSIEADLRDKTMSFNIDRRCQDLSQAEESRQSTPSLPSQPSDAAALRSVPTSRSKEQQLRNKRAELYRKGGARLVPKPPVARTDTRWRHGPPRAAAGVASNSGDTPSPKLAAPLH